ncbi:MAG: acylphosphatase [Tepidamorphaceae bacterium]|nr:acylphosphatase [Rhodobiaceae bacterium]MCC0050051.1 acylphosphatase [Rhodobiaceae bacterium]
MKEGHRSVHVVVRGRVQGVWYRGWTNEQAMTLALDGWVRNRRDGTVEAVLIGPRQSVDTMLSKMRDGPPAAQVENVEIVAEGVSAPSGFSVMPTQ